MIPSSGCDHPRRADCAHRVITTIVRGTHYRILLIPWIKLIMVYALHALIMTQPMRRHITAIVRTTRLEGLKRYNGNAEVGVGYTHGFNLPVPTSKFYAFVELSQFLAKYWQFLKTK